MQHEADICATWTSSAELLRAFRLQFQSTPTPKRVAIDDKQREGVRSVGASAASVQRYSAGPQVSQALYFWES